jgi:hypothetical protein
VLIGSLALAAVVVLLVFVMNGGSSAAQSSTDEGSTSLTVTPAAAPTPSKPPAASEGSVPGRPAPAIPGSVWTEADELYDRAAAQWNEAQADRRAGRTGDYQGALLASWDEFEKLRALIEPYTAWFEEADLEGWAMPADYDRLHRRLEVWDALRAKVRKLKPMKRR